MAAVPLDRQPAAAPEVRRVVWSDRAVDDLEEITTYVRGFNPAAAARLERQIVEVAESLILMPERGRPVGRERREIVVRPPYLMRYVVVGEEIHILFVRHAARRLEP